jgi:hypothetical protein
MQGSGPPETSRSPQLSADFVADVGDQKGEAAKAIFLSRPLAPLDWERQL